MRNAHRKFQILLMIAMPLLVGCVSYPTSHEAWDNGWRYQNIADGAVIES